MSPLRCAAVDMEETRAAVETYAVVRRRHIERPVLLRQECCSISTLCRNLNPKYKIHHLK
jgi:hypothetical protein